MNKLRWHPLSAVTEPRNHAVVQVYRDQWWIVNGAGDIALWDGRAPQCAQSRRLAEEIAARTDGAAGVVQVPVAFVPVRLDDYR